LLPEEPELEDESEEEPPEDFDPDDELEEELPEDELLPDELKLAPDDELEDELLDELAVLLPPVEPQPASAIAPAKIAPRPSHSPRVIMGFPLVSSLADQSYARFAPRSKKFQVDCEGEVRPGRCLVGALLERLSGLGQPEPRPLGV
jgi:hypothetical protein